MGEGVFGPMLLVMRWIQLWCSHQLINHHDLIVLIVSFGERHPALRERSHTRMYARIPGGCPCITSDTSALKQYAAQQSYYRENYSPVTSATSKRRMQ